ncbi:hypothetical protein HDC90_001775 [Pedobacter sp. AK013]|nr:hypothetical protein [Pedobacter sp. AK013]
MRKLEKQLTIHQKKSESMFNYNKNAPTFKRGAFVP